MYKIRGGKTHFEAAREKANFSTEGLKKSPHFYDGVYAAMVQTAVAVSLKLR